jgi:hypothetical protein
MQQIGTLGRVLDECHRRQRQVPRVLRRVFLARVVDERRPPLDRFQFVSFEEECELAFQAIGHPAIIIRGGLWTDVSETEHVLTPNSQNGQLPSGQKRG